MHPRLLPPSALAAASLASLWFPVVHILLHPVCVRADEGVPSHHAHARAPPVRVATGSRLPQRKGQRSRHARISGRHAAHPAEREHYDIDEFLHSGELFDWALFFAVFALFVWVRQASLKAVAVSTGIIVTFLLWLVLGAAYNLLIYWRWGADTGILWLDGFVLELVFSLENVFVFFAIAEAFAAPRLGVYKVLILIVYWQTLYDVVLYVGFAHYLDKIEILPYVLGVWLAIAGLHSIWHAALEMDIEHVFEQGQNPSAADPLKKSDPGQILGLSFRHSADHGLMESFPVRLVRHILGQRLALEYDDADPSLIFVRDSEVLKVSLLFLVLMFMVVADSVLEVDVTLTKIETLQHPYVSFTSSALASFALPEFFFLTWQLSIRCPLVKLGVAVIMLLFGTEMLLERFIEIGPLDGCAIILCILTLCILANETGRLLWAKRVAKEIPTHH